MMMHDRKIPARYIGNRVPERLIADFHRAVEEAGIMKKAGMAAAMQMFVRAGVDKRIATHQAVVKRYGRSR